MKKNKIFVIIFSIIILILAIILTKWVLIPLTSGPIKPLPIKKDLKNPFYKRFKEESKK